MFLWQISYGYFQDSVFKLNTRFILRLHISLSTNFTAFSIIRQCFVSISPNLSNHRCKRWYGIMCESYGIFICWALALKFVCEFVRLLLNIVLFHPFFCTYHINNLRLLLCLYFLVNIWNQRQVWQRCHCLSFIIGSNIIGTKGCISMREHHFESQTQQPFLQGMNGRLLRSQQSRVKLISLA